MITNLFKVIGGQRLLILTAYRVDVICGKVLLSGNDCTEELFRSGHFDGEALLNVYIVNPGTEV